MAPLPSDAVRLRPTRLDDLPFVMQAERDADNAPFIRAWIEQQHRAVIADETWAHLIIESAPDARPLGYCILSGLGDPDRSILLKRITITQKGRGFGRAAMRQIKALAFGEWRAHRLWLDVVTHNTRARRLYAGEGFREEGTLRDAAWIQGRFESLVIMSILEPGYRPSP
jgi:RimJ/RimL family protein N-acetyltransferase